eukprot:scaffold46989_cov62-Phaeocystis_antarctica.AAC.1
MMLLSDLAASDRLDSGCLVADPRTTSLFVRVSLAHRHATPSYRRTSPIPYASQVKEVLEEKGATWAGQCYKIGVVKKIFSELAVSITKAEDLLNQHQLANVAMQIQQAGQDERLTCFEAQVASYYLHLLLTAYSLLLTNLLAQVALLRNAYTHDKIKQEAVERTHGSQAATGW